MSEQIQFRTEHSRSVEDADKYRALETLKTIGLLIPVSDFETFHGRVKTPDETGKWTVDPAYANSSSGNVNIRPTLYTADARTAEDFAKRRAQDIIHPKYMQMFQEQAENYTPEERQKWLDRENQNHESWFSGLDDSSKKFYKHVVDEHGKLKPKTLDDLEVGREKYYLEENATQEEKQLIWVQAATGLSVWNHEITVIDSDALVVNLAFDDTKLDEDTRAQYGQALNTLTPNITAASPLDFYDREAVEPYVAAMEKLNKVFTFNEDIPAIAAEAGLDERVIYQLSGAHNARLLMRSSPKYLVRKLLENPGDIVIGELQDGEETKELPLNLEYVQGFLRASHIVGVKQEIKSATLSRDITSISFLDLEKVGRKEDVDNRKQSVQRKLGGIAATFGVIEQSHGEPTHPLLKLLADAHVKPSALVDSARAIPGFKAAFDGDIGNWEGFTLAEHTETVLRNFDENFADTLPVELLAPMRLAILSHDTGKPIAVSKDEKRMQYQYNAVYADLFLDRVCVDPRAKNLILAVIGDGQRLAFQTEVHGAGEPVKAKMRALATDKMKRFHESNEVNEAQIDGFIEMCKIMQICDSGAYTSMAITHSDSVLGAYRNAPSFNGSFAQPVGFGKRGLRIRQHTDKPASNSNAPEAPRSKSVV